MHQPHSLEEAYDLLDREPEAELLAGGTDFMVEVNAARRRPKIVVSLRDVPELGGWRRDGHDVVLGAGLTYSEMLWPDFADLVPCLSQAARTVGSPQIRNAGTIGGNLGTASPAGDTLPVLAALGARIGVGRLGATRTVTLDELVTGPKQSSLEPGELIVDVRLPAALGTQEFLKVGPRNAMIIAVANVALVVDWDARQVRVGLGSVGPVIIRPGDAEAFAASKIDWQAYGIAGGESALDEFAGLVRTAARPIDDHRSTAEYRRHAVGVCARRALERALQHRRLQARADPFEEEPWAS
ncbi:MAG: FAD binding domain-containing protein [Acidimicrobiales bacterium]